MLRSTSTRRADASGQKPVSIAARRLGLAVLAASAVGLGGCSTDLLRFDSPVFNLTGEDNRPLQPTAASAQDYPPTGAARAEARSNTYERGGYAAPVASVPSDRALARNEMRPPRVVLADVAPSGRSPSQQSEVMPLATGALSRRRSITVERGDTLYQLSRRHGVSVEALKDANDLTGNIIRPGQTLRLPSSGARVAGLETRSPSRTENLPVTRAPIGSGRFVTVASGDSLYAISRRTGVSVSELKRINGIEDVRRLQPGMRLALSPASGRMPATVAAGAQAQGTGVSRTDFGQTPEIRAKRIRTVSIGRDMAPAASEPGASASAPRILNGAPTAVQGAKRSLEDATSGDEGPSKFRWPAKGRIIATFNHSGRGAKNDGINISLPMGTPIQAVESGTVAYAGSELKGYGKLVLLRHDNGWVSAYAHASELLVKRGDTVERGQVIAKAGRSGGVTQPQLHFELRKQAKPVDPLPHLAAM